MVKGDKVRGTTVYGLLMVAIIMMVYKVSCAPYIGHMRVDGDGRVTSYMNGTLVPMEPTDRAVTCSKCGICVCGMDDPYSLHCLSCSGCLTEFVYSCPRTIRGYDPVSSCNCVNVCHNLTVNQSQTQTASSEVSYHLNVTCIGQCTFSVGQGIHLDANCTGDDAANTTQCVQSFSANLSQCAQENCSASKDELSVLLASAPLLARAYSKESHSTWFEMMMKAKEKDEDEKGQEKGSR